LLRETFFLGFQPGRLVFGKLRHFGTGRFAFQQRAFSSKWVSVFK